MVYSLKEFRLRLKKILESMAGKVVTPGDVVTLTGLPRYEVLATIHVLEALNFVELINEKGNFRIYKLTNAGLKLLRVLEEMSEIEVDIFAKPSEEIPTHTTSAAEATQSS